MGIDQILIELGRALLELFLILRGTHHGILQGTPEAAIFEAQGGTIGPGGFNHLNSLQAAIQAVQSRRDALTSALGKLNGVNSAVGSRVKDVCEPILKQSGNLLTAMRSGEQAATELAKTDPNRFSGVVVGQGGMGPEIGRTSQALVSNQLTQQASQLQARGIEPRLIPQARTALQSVAGQLRQLPMDAKDAVRNLSATLAAMRALLTGFAQQALLAGRVALAAALTTIEQALVTIGSRLTSPAPIVPKGVLNQIKKAAGLPADPEA